MIIVWLLPVVLVSGLIYWLFMSPYSQIFGKFPYKVKTTQKQIALTFDDGPNELYTSKLVDFLNSKGIKATFFQVGKNVKRFPELTKRMERTGHVIGNHSLSHAFSKYFSQPGFEAEIDKSQAIISRVIGKTPVFFRPPWLVRYPKLYKTLNARNLQIVSGEFCHNLEVFQPSAKRIARAALAKAKPGGIIIFHDGHDAKSGNRGQTVEAVKIVVAELSQRGFEFVTIDKLLGLKTPYQ